MTTLEIVLSAALAVQSLAWIWTDFTQWSDELT